MNKLKFITVTFLICISVISCNKVETTFDNETLDSNFVSKEDLYKIVNFSNPVMKSLKLRSSSGNKSDLNEVLDVTTIGGQKESVELYIVNYRKGGFIVVPADNRFFPILAISEKGNFPTNDTTLFVPGVKEWVNDIRNSIRVTRKSKVIQDKMISTAWKKFDYAYAIEKGIQSEIDDFPPCERDYDENSVITYYGPHMNTTWNQGDGYNDALASKGCIWDPQGQPYTGCIATAMAQIMRYNQHPNIFSWSQMTNYSGNSHVASLMLDIGQKVNMNWGCDGSGATMQKAHSAFKNNYGYPNASLQNYNHLTASNIVQYKPIMLAGGSHAWVADGVMNNQIWSCERDYRSGQLIWSNIGFWNMLHMNWGWGGSYDGYYSDSSWTPTTGSNYNSDRKMIVGL